MNEAIVRANANLVRNGDFSDLLEGWDSGYLARTRQEWYEGEGGLINYLLVKLDGWAHQEIIIEKASSDKARYRFNFLWETRHTESGWMRIFRNADVEPLLEVELIPSGTRDLASDQMRLAGGQPLDFSPNRYDELLPFEVESGDKLRIRISSPAAATSIQQICVTRVNLQLCLDPLELHSMRLDDELLEPGQVLYLCHGASVGNSPSESQHRLTFIPAPGSAWEGTNAALTIVGNPQDAIVATPEWGEEHSLESSWSIDCPWVGEEERYPIELYLINQYTANPYPIEASLGHHRLMFRERLTAAYFPLAGQTVRLGVQVASFYTTGALNGRTVNWTVDGDFSCSVITEDQGWAYFEYVAEKTGDISIEASVESLYYAKGAITTSFDVKVLAKDPWQDLEVLVDGRVTTWDAIGYPNRGSSYDLHVRLPPDSPLQNTRLSLHWSGISHEQLGVAVSPALELPVEVVDVEMVWRLTSEDWQDGLFSLWLECSQLLEPSPKKPMSLARNRVRIGEVCEANKSPVVEDRESVLLRLQVLHDVAGSDGEPVIGATVKWKTDDGDSFTYTGSGGWASLLYSPTQAITQVVEATVTSHQGLEKVGHDFDLRSILKSDWSDKVIIRLVGQDDNLFDWGLKCRKGEMHTLTVEALGNSSLIGKTITLKWRGDDPGIGLIVSDIDVSKTLREDEPLSWTLSSDLNDSLSRLFELRLVNDEIEDRELFGRLISPDLASEMSVVMDQLTSARGETLYPCLGAIHRYILRTHALSPLVGLPVSLKWSGTTPEDLGATVAPSVDDTQLLGDDGATWVFDFRNSQAPGVFSVSFLMDLGFETEPGPMSLGHNKVRIESWQVSPVIPVVDQDPKWIWAQVFSVFTEDAAAQVPVIWTVDGQEKAVETSVDGWSGFPFEAKSADEKIVEARVVSPYDEYRETRSTTVEVLDRDPWPELMFIFDGQQPQPLDENIQTFFPRRKGQYRIDVVPKENSALINHTLSLGMTGTGPSELGIRFDPSALGVPEAFSTEGLRYYFSVGDVKDGSFALCLADSRLARLSPEISMSLGAGTHVVKIAERQRVNKTLLWGESVTEQITVVSVTSGKPMSGVIVTWRSPDLGVETAVTNFYGVANICFVPITPGALELTAMVGDEQYSESIALPFFLNEPRKVNELVCEELSGYPGQQMTAQAWVVSARTGEPLADVEVFWAYENKPLASTFTGPDGQATVNFTLGAAGQALLWASVKGGLAGWDVKTLSLTANERPAAVASVVASPNPVRVQNYVTMTAVIVDKETREPMRNRKIQVSNNGGPFFETTTDHKGRYESYWRPMAVTDNISLAVKLNNADGTSDSGFVDVRVER